VHRPANRVSRLLWPAASILLGGLGLGLLVLGAFPELQLLHRRLAMAAAFAPYGVLAWVAAILVAATTSRGRRRWLVLPLVLGLAAHVLTLVRYLPAPTPGHGGAADLTVLTLNLRYGLADLDELLGVVERTPVDLLVLTEVTARNAAAFTGTGWHDALPYSAGHPGRDQDPVTGAGDPTGTMVLSRRPLTELQWDGTALDVNGVVVRVQLPGREFTLVAAHPESSTARLVDWKADAVSLSELVASYSTGPLIVAGDLNATAEQFPLRALETSAGLADTARNQGWLPTFPADQWFPPLVQIDHVLVSPEFTTIDVSTVRVPDTDHLGLLVRLGFAR
jgi:endonuclease/exonuclease/phosphatase (EEP) superfamily protein YafD